MAAASNEEETAIPVSNAVALPMSTFEMWLFSEGEAPALGTPDIIQNVLRSFGSLTVRVAVRSICVCVCNGAKFADDDGSVKVQLFLEGIGITARVEGPR